jgi:hypothetical protein
VNGAVRARDFEKVFAHDFSRLIFQILALGFAPVLIFMARCW